MKITLGGGLSICALATGISHEFHNNTRIRFFNAPVNLIRIDFIIWLFGMIDTHSCKMPSGIGNGHKEYLAKTKAAPGLSYLLPRNEISG
jgi:hypothetical protein